MRQASASTQPLSYSAREQGTAALLKPLSLAHVATFFPDLKRELGFQAAFIYFFSFLFCLSFFLPFLTLLCGPRRDAGALNGSTSPFKARLNRLACQLYAADCCLHLRANANILLEANQGVCGELDGSLERRLARCQPARKTARLPTWPSI